MAKHKSGRREPPSAVYLLTVDNKYDAGTQILGTFADPEDAKATCKTRWPDKELNWKGDGHGGFDADLDCSGFVSITYLHIQY